MENFRTCPVCKEVPETTIFQCSAGHVICYSCVINVKGGLCPQCRVPFKFPKIRNFALEEILDAQDFECKFKENGCSHLCKRQELTNHFGSCSHHPDTVNLCQQMGFVNCDFRLGYRSKAEIILHFKYKHDILTGSNPDLLITHGWENVLAAYRRKRKIDASIIMSTIGIGIIVCTDATDKSPLFLIHGKWNYPIRCWSFECIKIWDSETPLDVKYIAHFTFNRDSSSNPSQGQSSSSASRMSKNYPFPLGGK